jgi:hypothetical protein
MQASSADPGDEQPLAENGMRGERNGPRVGSGAPRQFTGVDGTPITVEETSGTAGVTVEPDKQD